MAMTIRIATANPHNYSHLISQHPHFGEMFSLSLAITLYFCPIRLSFQPPLSLFFSLSFCFFSPVRLLHRYISIPRCYFLNSSFKQTIAVYKFYKYCICICFSVKSATKSNFPSEQSIFILQMKYLHCVRISQYTHAYYACCSHIYVIAHGDI